MMVLVVNGLALRAGMRLLRKTLKPGIGVGTTMGTWSQRLCTSWPSSQESKPSALKGSDHTCQSLLLSARSFLISEANNFQAQNIEVYFT